MFALILKLHGKYFYHLSKPATDCLKIELFRTIAQAVLNWICHTVYTYVR